MGLSDLYRSVWNHARLRRGVRALSQKLAKRTHVAPGAAAFAKHRKRIWGVALILGALMLGAWAHDSARTEALEEWLRGHPPSARVWRHALESRGYQQPRGRLTAAAALPLTDEEDSVWISADAAWVAVAAELYCVECLKPPQAWEPMGRGWPAFDPLLARVDEAAALRRPVARRPAERDPYELRY